MPLFKTPNQPLFSDPNRPTDEYCPGDYCHLVASDDTIYAQFTQTPCGVDLSCDSDFTDVSLNNLFTKDFTSVCPDGFNIVGTAWSCTVNGLEHATAASTETIGLNPAGLTQYSMYKVTIQIDGMTQGWVELYLGTVVNGASTGQLTSNDTYTFYMQYNEDPAFFDDVQILCSGTDDDLDFYDGYIVSLQIDEVVSTCWDNGNGTWLIDGINGAVKLDTGTGILADSVGGNYLTANKYYVLTVVVEDYIGGTLTPKIGNFSGDDITGNGTFEIYGVTTLAGYVSFTPSSDFVGKIVSIDIKLLKYTGEITAQIITAEGKGVLVEDVSSYLTFYNQYVTLAVTPSTDLNLAEGCYRLAVYDECELQYGEFVTNGEFVGGSGGFCPDWANNSATAQYDYTGGQFELSYNGTPSFTKTPFANNTYNPLFFADDYVGGLTSSNYRITFEIISINATAGLASDIQASVNIGNQTTANQYFGTADGTPPFTATYDVVVPVPYSATTDAPRKGRVQVFARFLDSGTQAEGEIVVDNISVVKLSPYEATYISECFVVSDAPPVKSKLLIGTCDDEQFGFEFTNSGFKLLQRVECRALAPNWKVNRETYSKSTGNKDLNYADVEKYWEFFVEAASASTHGAIAIQINCDHFYIGDMESDVKEYITTDEDYQPLWPRDGAADLAPSRIELRIADAGMLFNRKC